MTTLKWVRGEDKYGDTTWTCGEWRIDRQEFSLPTKSVGYIVYRAGVRTKWSVFDYLADAKHACAELLETEQRRPTREDRRYRHFDRDGRPMWISVPA